MRTRTTPIVILCLLAALSLPRPVQSEEPAKKIPVTVKADKLDYDRANDIYVAEGNVRVEQDGTRIEADRLVLNNRTGEAVAEGKVYLQEKGDVIRAGKIVVNIVTKAGLIYNGELFMGKDNLHLKGERIERKSETEFHIENGIFTTCDEGEWYLKAEEIDVDMDRYATGKGVSFNMIGLPVFYTPYLLFPVRRQTGLLIPEPGYSSSEGFLMRNSFFWAISDYRDMTFYSDYRARIGHGTAAEYRYVNSRDSGGRLFYNYFNTFDKYRVPGVPDGRWLLTYNHDEEIAEDLSVRADINLVSDYAYFLALEKRLELRSQPYLDSDLFYVERWDTASLYLLGQYAVDLTQENNETTIQKLPELRYNIHEEKIAGPLHVNFEGSTTNFARTSGHNIMRADFNPRLSAVFGGRGVALTPRVGVRATFYDRSVVSKASGTFPEVTSPEPAERRYYHAGADLNARLSRVYGRDRESGFGRIRHSIEPTVSYNYVPDIDQEKIPQLDPIDFVAGRNTISLSLINRLTAHYKDASGFKNFDLAIIRVSQSYDLDQAREPAPAAGTQVRSAVRADLFIKTPSLLSFSAFENYDTYTDRVTSSSESINMNTGTLRFALSRQYLREPSTRFLIASAGAKIRKWEVDAGLWHDIVQARTTQQEYRLHYASQCWGLGVSYITKPGETEYRFTLDLKGLGALKF